MLPFPHSEASTSFSLALSKSGAAGDAYSSLCLVSYYITQRASVELGPHGNAHSPLHLVQDTQSVNLIFRGVSQLRIPSKLLRLSPLLASK